VANNKRLCARIGRGAIIAGSALVLLALLAAIAISPVPMRGAEMFGVLARKIKGHPGATTAIALGAGVALWLLVGALAACQEWRAGRGAS
jgi:hypothetical protein